MTEATLLLSRVQFAFTIGYHILFPALTIGLALFLVVLEALELRSGDARYRHAWTFWSRIFALSFGMGVVSGVVLSYEIGTNFGRFAEVAAPVVGPLMSYEVLSAFFLEAGFLGVMLLGRRRVGQRMHFFATCMVAVGTVASAFWILSANSWMHTPAGFRLEGGTVHVESWTQAIFNPSFPYRFAHMLVAAYLTTSFVVVAVGAWHALHREHADFGRHMLRLGLAAAGVLAPLQIVVGDLHGLNTFEHQPIKVAAIEANWHTEAGVPLLLFAWPDAEAERNRYEVAVPRLGSWILTHQGGGVVQGLTEVPPEDRPPVALVFWSFRLMVGCGLAMLALAWLGLWRLRRGTLESGTAYLRLLVPSAPLGFVALLAGWVTTECGRQPWAVQGLLRTADAVSPVPGASVAFTLALFVATYAALLAAFLLLVRHLVRRGPPREEPPQEGLPPAGERPLFPLPQAR